MVAEWHRMAEEELFLGERWRQPAKKAAGPQIDPQWSNYSAGVGTKTGASGRGRSSAPDGEDDED